MRASWIGVPQCAPASIAGPAVKASRLSWVTPEFFLRGPTMDRPPIGEIAHCGSQAWRWHQVFMGPVSLGGHCRYSPDGMDTRWLLRDVDLARAEEPEGAGATREAAFRVLPCVRSVACAPAAPDPGNPAPRGGIVLAASAAPCRQAGTGARGQDRTARRMAMASRIRQGVSSANNLPHAASTLSGGGLFARTGPLQRLRSAGLSVGLAPGFLRRRQTEPECLLACCLRRRLAALDRADRASQDAEAAPEQEMRDDRAPPPEISRSGSSRSALRCLVRASLATLARASVLLGRSQSPGDQQTCPSGEVCRRSSAAVQATRRCCRSGCERGLIPQLRITLVGSKR